MELKLLALCRSTAAIALLGDVATLHAQQDLAHAPGYARYTNMINAATNAVKLGAVTVSWKDGGKAFEFSHGGKRYRYDVDSRTRTLLSGGTNDRSRALEPDRRRQRSGDSPGRAKQFTSVLSPDGAHKAFYKDRNVWLSDTNGSNAVQITKDGSESARTKSGTATWAYGEELFQATAMWWSSNSQKLAFYRFDESQVPDYYMALRQTRLQDSLGTEAYPKAGGTNPVVDIFIYDLKTRRSTRVDVRSGQPFNNDVVGHYVYRVSWTHDSRELLFHRTDRRQKALELCAADAETGRVRVIVREEWPASWTENLPEFRPLRDGNRFIWCSERSGWKNYYLYDFSGRLITPLTQHAFEVAGITHVDDERGLLYYTARDGDNVMKPQLHCVKLDGTGDRRLSDPRYHHTIDFAPDGRHYLDISQAHDVPPVTRLRSADGSLLDTVANSDATRFRQLGLKPVELLKFKAADGATDLYGMLHRPSDFNRWTKYPLLVSVYAGPETSGARETFTMPNPLTELGFLMASFDSRSVGGRGKRALDPLYQHFGTIEIDDQAAGVRSLFDRWYVSEQRVGIFGTSYGGYASAMALLRYPEVFRAAVASSAVTDWHNYDTIYTERYMGLPQDTPEAWKRGSAMTYADKLRGRLMIFYGTADDNVHPANSLQLIDRLQRAGKSFDVQVGPDQGHMPLGRDRMMEFFIEHLRRR